MCAGCDPAGAHSILSVFRWVILCGGAMSIQIGQRVPEVVLPDLNGRPVTLHFYRGRKVILFTWASW